MAQGLKKFTGTINSDSTQVVSLTLESEWGASANRRVSIELVFTMYVSGEKLV
jgi:hypothetical protein